MLDGAHSACAWDIDPRAAQPGIFPADQLPQLERKDYVQHSNDSAWMANPKAPLTGYSPLISQDQIALGARARFALQRLQDLDKQPISIADLQHMVLDNQVYLAGQVMPDLLKFCAQQTDASLNTLCTHLKDWDQKANLDSGLGLVHFIHVLEQMQQVPDVWRVAFDPRSAQTTPRGLAIERPEVAKALREAMLASVAQVTELGLNAGAHWGDIQVSGNTPMHGGPQELGIYNAMQSVPRADGKREVVSGSSYLQIVTFDDKGPKAEGVLAFSLSSDPASPHFKDQTQAFSEKKLSPLPFTEQQIKADPQYQRQVIRE